MVAFNNSIANWCVISQEFPLSSIISVVEGFLMKRADFEHGCKDNCIKHNYTLF